VFEAKWCEAIVSRTPPTIWALLLHIESQRDQTRSFTWPIVVVSGGSSCTPNFGVPSVDRAAVLQVHRNLAKTSII